ncbi:MAG: Spermidine synthase-like protein [Gemmatimonadetes bacterium]|nr:Spermidine synthase-like protein [Gemmatimonadota bacterium]
MASSALRLACYSGLILFFELAFIRYTSAYVRVFGFYLNFVLIATFLGMGVGLLQAHRASALKWMAPATMVMITGAVGYFSAARIAVPNDQHEFLWGIFDSASSSGQMIPMVLAVTALFALSALFFVPLGALMGAEFRKLPPLRAYTFDIVGSLCGIGIFAALSATRQSPITWFAIGSLVWMLASRGDWRYSLTLALSGLAMVTIATWTEGTRPEHWSPYYRINVTKVDDRLRIAVNGSLHQFALDLDSARAMRNEYTAVARPAYLRPYQFAARLDTVMVLGAGSGNDVALLLHSGAKYIDAVEIDPTIADIGKTSHVQQPYSDPRVHLHINDARAFLRQTPQKYDAIIFGTLDSQTLLSGMSSVRLDNYVYTVEAMQSARERLKPDGTLIMYHMSSVRYIAAKIYQMLGQAFGAPPRVYYEFDYLFNYTFVAGYGARGALPPANAPWLTQQVTLPHDDWPYLYLSSRVVPAHYIAALIGVIVVTLLMLGIGASDVLRRGFDGPMFFMGAGFLLVETKSVTEMSLLFGSTWTVNLLVFTSILVMVLCANLLVERRRPLPLPWLFGGLFGALVLAYLIPVSQLLWMPIGAQWIAGGLMVALPVLFAALIFSTLLSRRADATQALAYNLLGAIVGGVLEYSSMAFGIKALYVIALITYLAAFALSRREKLAVA